MKTTKKPLKIFKIFDINRDGKGVYEQENRKPNLKFFFILLFRKMTQLLQLNALMLPMVLPIVGAVVIYVFGAKLSLAAEPSFAPVWGISKLVESPALFNELEFLGHHVETTRFTPWMIIGMVLLGLFLLVTFGWQNVGSAYVLRGLFRGDPVFVFSDYFHAIKKNFVQGLIIGVIDFVCCAVLIIDLIYFFPGQSMSSAIFFGIIVAAAIMYVLMRFYVYQLLITFELKTLKILKNALILSILGIFRNLVAVVGIVILIAIHVLLVLWLLPMGISIPIILPFFYILSFIGFITVYAAYPVIQKYMITPYENTNSEENDSSEESAETDTTEASDK